MEVLGNRNRRNALAEGALRQAKTYSMEAWQARLVDVVREAVSL
jgi:hypothetical protein